MNYDFLSRQALRLSPADRARFDALAAQRTWEAEIERADLVCCSINGGTDDEDGNDCILTLHAWAAAAIDGKTYRRKSGPDVRWAVRLPSGPVLEIRPRYWTVEDARKDWERQAPDCAYEPDADSNWQPAYRFDLHIYRKPTDRAAAWRGVIDTEGTVITNGPWSLTDDIVGKLWAIHTNPARAFVDMPWCGCCHRPLTDEVSRTLGIGPDCAAQLGIEHSLATARVREAGR